MEQYEKAIITALCMVYDGSRLLMQNRVKEDWHGYTFPGGHIEKEESFIQGIKREIFEETGLTIHHPNICGIKQFQTEQDERYIVLLFKTNKFEGELTSSEEGEMVWVERESLCNLPLAKDFMMLLKVFDQEDINEMIYEVNDSEGYCLKLY